MSGSARTGLSLTGAGAFESDRRSMLTLAPRKSVPADGFADVDEAGATVGRLTLSSVTALADETKNSAASAVETWQRIIEFPPNTLSGPAPVPGKALALQTIYREYRIRPSIRPAAV